MKKNGIVSLWKFLFSIVIVFFHTNLFYLNLKNPFFKGGYIAVEFFFIVSGYFFARRTLNEEYNEDQIGKDTIKFISKKISLFASYLLVAYLIILFLCIKYRDFTTDKYINSILDLILLNNFGIGKIRLLGQLWYLSVLIAVLFILYPLLKKHKENFIYIASPIITIFCLGIIGHYYNNLDISHKYWFYIINPSLLRGFAEINIGMIIYLINSKMISINLTNLSKTILTIIGEGLLITVLLVTTFISKSSRYDFIMLLMISIAVLIICSTKTLEYKLLSNRFIYYLDKISMIIYINHVSVIFFINSYSRFKIMLPINKAFTVVILTIIISIIEERIMLFIRNRFNKVPIKKLFVKQ